MANLPAKTDQSSVSKTEDPIVSAIADALASGKRPADIARQLAPDDAAKRKRWRTKIRNMVYDDARLAVALGKRAKGEMLMDLVPTVSALGERAKRGRPDAAKLIMEATGFHNPRVQHEHSGEIKVKLEMPRPKFDADAGHITDADVVD